MKTTGQRYHLHDKHQLDNFNEWVRAQWVTGNKPTVQMMGEERTMSQNAMWNALYGQIAGQMEDKSVIEVRRECKLHYGIGILKAGDPAFSDWYDTAIKGLTYEDKLLLMTYMDVTSLFNKKQGTEYLDTIIAEYGRQGISLIDPRIGGQP